MALLVNVFGLHAIKELVKLVEDTKSENMLLLSSMEPGMRSVLHGKQLVALQQLLDKHALLWPDRTVVSEISAGAHLVGMQQHSGLFPFEVQLPSISVSQLRAQSVIHNQSMLQRTKSSGDAEMDRDLWTQTMDEQSKGWLSGPFYDINEACFHVKDTVATANPGSAGIRPAKNRP